MQLDWGLIVVLAQTVLVNKVHCSQPMYLVSVFSTSAGHQSGCSPVAAGRLSSLLEGCSFDSHVQQFGKLRGFMMVASGGFTLCTSLRQPHTKTWHRKRMHLQLLL